MERSVGPSRRRSGFKRRRYVGGGVRAHAVSPAPEAGPWEQQVAEWNNRYPLDRWWRQRNGIRFRSPEHRATSQVAIRYEYEEEKLFNGWEAKATKQRLEREEMEVTGIWLNPPTFAATSEAEEKELFEEVDMDDLSMFDDPLTEQESGESDDVTL